MIVGISLWWISLRDAYFSKLCTKPCVGFVNIVLITFSILVYQSSIDKKSDTSLMEPRSLIKNPIHMIYHIFSLLYQRPMKIFGYFHWDKWPWIMFHGITLQKSSINSNHWPDRPSKSSNIRAKCHEEVHEVIVIILFYMCHSPKFLSFNTQKYNGSNLNDCLISLTTNINAYSLKWHAVIYNIRTPYLFCRWT